jgi:hypothetical protein
VEKEVVKLGAKLKRAHEKRARRQPRVTYVKERS